MATRLQETGSGGERRGLPCPDIIADIGFASVDRCPLIWPLIFGAGKAGSLRWPLCPRTDSLKWWSKAQTATTLGRKHKWMNRILELRACPTEVAMRVPPLPLPLARPPTGIARVTDAGGRPGVLYRPPPAQLRHTALRNRRRLAPLGNPASMVAERYGIAYTIDEDLAALYRKVGHPLPDHNASRDRRLPLAATYMMEPSGSIGPRHGAAGLRTHRHAVAVADCVRCLRGGAA